MLFIGVDPGLYGALAVLNNKQVVGIYDAPLSMSNDGLGRYDLHSVAKLIGDLKKSATGPKGTGIEALVEAIHAFPGRGGRSATNPHAMFLQGEGLMLWKAMLVAFKIPTKTVSPQRWRSSFFPAVDSSKRGAQSIEKALKLYPKAKVFINLKKHDGRAEALLIAEYCRKVSAVRCLI